MHRIAEIEQRKAEIRASLESGESVDLTALEQEVKQLNQEKQELEARTKLASEINVGQAPAVQIEKIEERGAQMIEVIDVIATPEYRSAYLKNLQGKMLTDTERRTLTTAAGSAGAAVPTTTLNQIIDKLRQVSVLFPRITVTNIAGNVALAVANAKNSASWKAEGTNGTAADDTVSSVTLGGYELIKLVEISAAARQMTIDAFEAYIAAEIGRQMAIAIENAILNGTGTNQPTGILGGITWTANTNMINWAANAAVSYDNIVDALALLPTMYHQNAAFVMSRKTLFGGIRKLKDQNGQPLFQTNVAQDAPAYTILGYPIVVDDYIADDIILIGDFSYYYFNFSQQPTIDVSLEAGFASGKVTYRGLAVADGKPALAEPFVKLSKTGV